LNSLLRHGDRLNYAKVLDPQSQSLVEVLKQLRRVMIVRDIDSLKSILALHIQ